MEKKREAINDYLINNHNGEVRKKASLAQPVGRLRGFGEVWWGVGGRERGGDREREKIILYYTRIKI